jgi:hypothetical protein
VDQQDYEKPARTGGHIGLSEEGGQDTRTKGDQTEQDYPLCRGGISLVKSGPAQQRSCRQPGHKANALRDMPDPAAFKARMSVNQQRAHDRGQDLTYGQNEPGSQDGEANLS